MRDQDEAFHRLVEAAAAGDLPSTGLADRVFIEPSEHDDAPVEMAKQAPSPSEAVRIVAGGDPDRVDLEASLSRPGWVVLADTFYPGWTATIDGVTTPIHPVDLLFRGVFVRGGAHRIAFRYHQWSSGSDSGWPSSASSRPGSSSCAALYGGESRTSRGSASRRI